MTTPSEPTAARRRQTRQEAAEQTRQALLDAAWDLFAERGYADTTLEQIADRAGTTRTPIYAHFGDKENLFFALWVHKRWPVRLPSEFAPLGTSLRDYLSQADRVWGEHLEDPELALHVELMLVVQGLVRRHPQLRSAFELEITSSLAAAERELQAYADASGEPLPMPVERLAVMFTAVNLGLLQLSLWPTAAVSGEEFKYMQLALLGPGTSQEA